MRDAEFCGANRHLSQFNQFGTNLHVMSTCFKPTVVCFFDAVSCHPWTCRIVKCGVSMEWVWVIYLQTMYQLIATGDIECPGEEACLRWPVWPSRWLSFWRPNPRNATEEGDGPLGVTLTCHIVLRWPASSIKKPRTNWTGTEVLFAYVRGVHISRVVTVVVTHILDSHSRFVR